MPALAALILALFCFSPQEAVHPEPNQQQPGATLTGTVTDSASGTLLNKVQFLAEPIGPHADSRSASTTTNAKSSFTMVDLPPGEYRLKATRNGYLDTYYGATRSAQQQSTTGSTLTLKPGQQMTGLELKLLPFGVIAGTVRDPEGEPVVGATITLLRQHYDRPGQFTTTGVAEANTDDLGHYRIPDLIPGRYFILASPKNDGLFGFSIAVDHSPRSPENHPAILVPTLYPGVFDPSAAQAIDVGSGSRILGADIGLVRSRVFHVSGRVLSPAGAQAQKLWLSIPPQSESFLFGTDPKNSAGDFEFSTVPAGSYTLRVRVDPGEHIERVPLTVNGDLDNVRITVHGPSIVSGRVTIENQGEPLSHWPGAAVRFTNGQGRGATAELHGDHQFEATLSSGRYDIELPLDKSGLIIKSIRSEGVDIYETGLTVSESGSSNVEVVLAPEGGQLEGKVLDEDEKPVPGVTVVAIASPGLRTREDAFHVYITDQDGRYHFENIRPGDYRVFAWQDVEPNAWYDPEFMKSVEDSGERVNIQARGHETSLLHLKLPGAGR